MRSCAREFPGRFGKSRVRAYGFPGIRQTRWIVGRQQLTVDDVRAGTRFADAIARTAWPIELHDHGTGHHWHTFPEDHVHYVPLGSLTPADADNVVAAGRCIDADNAALSSVRVMGPCIAMGAAAAHALDLAGTGSVHQIDLARARVACLRQCGADGLTMRLTDHEKAMLDGSHGAAKARAMDLLLRYGQALGAERLVETNNVAGAFNASTPSVRALAARGFDAVYSELNLDSNDVVEVPRMAVNTCQLITGIDNAKWRIQGSRMTWPNNKSAARRSLAAAVSTCTRPARPIKSATCQCSASIAPGWNPPPWSIAIQCSALAPTPKARRAPALRP